MVSLQHTYERIIMDDQLFVDSTDGMACHVYYASGRLPYAVRLIDTDSDNTVTLRRFIDAKHAHAFVRACLPNLFGDENAQA